MDARGRSVHTSLVEFAAPLGWELAIVNLSLIAHLDLM
jgi:hypothetical protein